MRKMAWLHRAGGGGGRLQDGEDGIVGNIFIDQQCRCESKLNVSRMTYPFDLV